MSQGIVNQDNDCQKPQLSAHPAKSLSSDSKKVNSLKEFSSQDPSDLSQEVRDQIQPLNVRKNSQKMLARMKTMALEQPIKSNGEQVKKRRMTEVLHQDSLRAPKLLDEPIDNSKIKRYGRPTVRETYLEKFLGFLNQYDLQPSLFMEDRAEFKSQQICFKDIHAITSCFKAADQPDQNKIR